MNFDLIQSNGNLIAEVTSSELILSEIQDALDLMANAGYQGSHRIILYEKNIKPEFFDLKSRIAGDILQKFTNYRIRLAIVGDFSKYESKSLRDFIYESNKHGRVIFTGSREEAIEKLSK